MPSEKDKIPVVPCLRITAAGVDELRYSFDTAWHFARSCDVPNQTRFVEWMRKP